MSDFSAYLNFVCGDRRVCDARSLYTETDAFLSLEAQTVKRQERENEPSETLRQQTECLPVITGLRKYALGEKREHTLLVGRPGSGKSTALKQIFLELAAAALTDDTQPIPVLVQLKSDRPILELICVELRRVKPRVTLNQIDDWLLEDKLVLLLDGINEIPSDGLRQKLQELRDNNPTTPMIFAARDLAVGGDLGIERRLEMRPLTELQMREFVQKYLPEYGEVLLRQLKDSLREVAETPLLLKMLCNVFDPNTQQIPQSKGELFQRFDRDYQHIKKDVQVVPASENFWEFKSEVLQHLAFTMIQADSQEPTKAWLTLPKNQAERILEKWLVERGLMNAPTRAKLWLKDLLNHHLLQVAVDPEKIEFHHQLFQEYYAAEALLVMLRDNHIDVMDERFQHFYLNYLKWTEPIAIMISLVADESQVLHIVKLALDVGLQLGAKLAGQAKQDFQEKAVGLILKQRVLRRGTFPPRFKPRVKLPRKVIIQLLGDTQSDQAIPRLKEIFRRQNIPYLERIFHRQREEILEMSFMAIGKIRSEKAFQSLFFYFRHVVHPYFIDPIVKYGSEKEILEMYSLITSPDSVKKGNTPKERFHQFWMCFPASIVKHRLEAAIPILKQWLQDAQMPLFARERSIELLNEIGSEKAILALKESYDNISNQQEFTVSCWENGYNLFLSGLAKHEGIRFNRTPSMHGGIRFNRTPSMQEPETDPDDLDREYRPNLPQMIRDVLRRYEIDTTPLTYKQLLALADPQTRVMGEDLLQIFGCQSISIEVWQALLSGDLSVRLPALMNLEPSEDEAANWVLQKALNDQNQFVQKVAAIKLGKVRSQEEITIFWSQIIHITVLLNNTLRDGSFNKEISIVFSLIFWKACWHLFCNRNRKPPFEFIVAELPIVVYELAVEELGKIGSKTAIAALCKVMHGYTNDSSQYFRFTAVKTLQRMSSHNHNAVKALQQGLTSKHWDVRSHSAEALRLLAIASKRNTYEKALPTLLKLFWDKSPDVRFNAAAAFSTIANHQRLPDLNSLISTRVGREALGAMSAIQLRCQFYNYAIAQQKLAPHMTERSPSNLLDNIYKNTQAINQRTKQMADQPSINISGGNFPGINNFTPNQGNQNYTTIDTQNNYFGSDETLRQQLADLNEFIAELETKHPNLQTPAEADKILEAEIVQVQTENPTRWQTLRRQMSLLKRQLLNPDRHLQATKATLIEVAKSAYEKSLIVKAIITYLDKLSEEPNHGA